MARYRIKKNGKYINKFDANSLTESYLSSKMYSGFFEAMAAKREFNRLYGKSYKLELV